jgi:signal transduction histidine kinase
MKLRLRLALALAASFLIAGAVVLGVNVLLYQDAVYGSPPQQLDQLLDRLGSSRAQARSYMRQHPEAVFEFDFDAPTPSGMTVNEAFRHIQRDAHERAVDRARTWSVVALVLTAIGAALVGWVVAGRAIRPLRSITARARAASATDLSSRVALDGPHDEIQELGDTFDGMLARLESAFIAQRRFSTQVSHELRTPLAIISSETELLQRNAPAEEQYSLGQIRDATDRADRMITALLVLSRSGSGDLVPDDLDLDRITGDVLGEVVNESGWRDLRVDLDLEAAPVRADPALLERLIANLLSNAARHNRPGGWIAVRTRRDHESAVLEIENSVPPGTALPGRPDDGTSRSGIGLTVVDAVVAAHGGNLTWSAPSDDSVRVSVRLPLAASVAAIPVSSA